MCAHVYVHRKKQVFYVLMKYPRYKCSKSSYCLYLWPLMLLLLLSYELHFRFHFIFSKRWREKRSYDCHWYTYYLHWIHEKCLVQFDFFVFIFSVFVCFFSFFFFIQSVFILFSISCSQNNKTKWKKKKCVVMQ